MTNKSDYARALSTIAFWRRMQFSINSLPPGYTVKDFEREKKQMQLLIRRNKRKLNLTMK